jgi:hypothetical protein
VSVDERAVVARGEAAQSILPPRVCLDTLSNAVEPCQNVVVLEGWNGSRKSNWINLRAGTHTETFWKIAALANTASRFCSVGMWVEPRRLFKPARYRTHQNWKVAPEKQNNQGMVRVRFEELTSEVPGGTYSQFPIKKNGAQ